jgi:hypothetical protein
MLRTVAALPQEEHDGLRQRSYRQVGSPYPASHQGSKDEFSVTGAAIYARVSSARQKKDETIAP